MIINNKHIKVRRFNSGEMRLLFDDFRPLAQDGKMEILYEGEETLFELFVIVKFLQDKKMKVSLTLAYLPYQRMDHNNGYEASTLKYVAELFNSLKLQNLKVCEPHCSVDLFKNAKAISIVDAIYAKVTKEMGFDEEKDYIVFTDKGAQERYSHLGKNHIYFQKERDLKSGQIVSHKMIGKILPKRKVLLIDDIISSGATIINCAKMMGKTNFSIISGHFEKNKLNNRVLELENVQKVFSSNSLTKKSHNDKLVLFDVKDLI